MALVHIDDFPAIPPGHGGLAIAPCLRISWPHETDGCRDGEERSPQVNRTRNYEVAIHEAGHTVIAAVLGILRSDSTITIIPEKNGLLVESGSVTISKEAGFHDSGKPWSARYTRKVIFAFYAGPAVTQRLYPKRNLLEEGGDCELDMINATRLKGRLLLLPEYSWSFEEAALYPKERTWKRAVALVESNWPSIKAVAENLLERGTIIGAEVKATIKVQTP
jgi:hypothetical protein